MFDSAPSGRCQFFAFDSYLPRTKIRSKCFPKCGCYQERCNQFHKNWSSSQSLCSRLDKKSPPHPDLGQKRARKLFRLRKQCRHTMVHSWLANLHPQEGSVLRVVEGRSCDRPSTPSDELRALCEEGQLDKALDVLFRMDQQGATPSVQLYRFLLQACSRRKALPQAKRVHSHMVKHWPDFSSLLGESLVSALAKCGGLDDSLQLLSTLPRRSVFSWTAVISGYATSGQGKKALRVYKLMLEDGVLPNAYTIVSLLKICSSKDDLELGKHIHAEACKYRCETDLIAQTCLVDMYGKCGSIPDAEHVFQGMFRRDLVSWNAMLAAYAQQGLAEKALQLYGQMQAEGVSANSRTVVSALQACGVMAEKEEDVVVDGPCAKIKSLEQGRAIHADARRKGYDLDIFVGNTLVSMYGKCGSIQDAENVFDGLSQHDVVSWNAMLSAYVEQGRGEEALQLYGRMQEEHVVPDQRSFVSGFQACGNIAEKEPYVIVEGRPTKAKCLVKAKALHTDAWTKGYCADIFVATALISLYAKCGSIMDAQNAFDGLLQRDVGAWNAMLAAYVEQGDPVTALQLYEQMCERVACPDARSFVSALQACSLLAEKEVVAMVDGRAIKVVGLHRAKTVHAEAQRKGYNSDVFIGSTLLIMYGKCGSIADAQSVFDGLSNHDVVTWTAMIAAYVDQGQAEKALQIYDQMQHEGASPNEGTFVSALQACVVLAEMGEEASGRHSTNVNYLEQGKAIHAETRRKGYDTDILIGSSIISMYVKCGSIVDAQNVFDGLSHRDVVAWTAILAAYVEHGQAEKALQVYKQMCEEGVRPDEITLVWFLQACSQTGDLALLRQIHHTLACAGKSLSPFLASSLISAYGRCASMVDAQTVFDALPDADIVPWNALIASYARQGDSAASLQCYEKMQSIGVKGNEVTLLSVLSACSRAGLVDKGIDHFVSMTSDQGITPGIEHYVCMVDLLGRGGCFSTIENLLSAMQVQPSLAIWVCLLGACQKHGEVELGKQAFDRAVHLEPTHPAAYVLMSNIYADAGLSDLAKQVHELRHAAGAWKQPGQTWILHDNQVHSFVVGNWGQKPQQKQLFDILKSASLNLKQCKIPD